MNHNLNPINAYSSREDLLFLIALLSKKEVRNQLKSLEKYSAIQVVKEANLKTDASLNFKN